MGVYFTLLRESVRLHGGLEIRLLGRMPDPQQKLTKADSNSLSTISLLPQSRADLGQALGVIGRAWPGDSFSGALPALTMLQGHVLHAEQQL